jgi:hypothetical protein
VIAIVTAGFLVGGTGAVVLREAGSWLSPAGAEAANAAAKPSATTTTTTTTTTRSTVGAKPANGTTVTTNTAAKPVTSVTVAAVKGVATAAPTTSTVHAPAMPAGAVVVASTHTVESATVRRLRGDTNAKAATVQTTTQVEDQVHYQYNAIGRRDPFVQMVGNFVGDDVGGDAPVDVGGIKVVGIVWGADSFALVEDGRGNSLILRRGDKVMNGYVEDLKRDAMVVKLTMDGLSQSVAIPLTRKGDQTHATR